MTVDAPTWAAIEQNRAQLGTRIRTTPLVPWVMPEAPPGSEVVLKCELWQVTGSFKARGALTVMSRLDPAACARGVTAVSAGNHAIAVAWAARELGTTAKVVMMQNAEASRVAKVRALGAELELLPDVHAAFARAKEIEQQEGRFLVHPFEGPDVALGTATLGLELVQQAGPLDAVVVPIGGGGLCAGVSAAVKQAQPRCAVYGVEPTGADSMRRSLDAGSPQSIDRVRTIADSLGAPYALPYSFALCQRFVDDVVLVTDDELRAAMQLLYDELRFVVEPACAAATAALRGPLHARLTGKRVALILCGSNWSAATWSRALDPF